MSHFKTAMAINHVFVSHHSEYKTNPQYIYTCILLQISLTYTTNDYKPLYHRL